MGLPGAVENELDYLVTGWTGYGLIATGLLVMLLATLSNPRARKAYVGWGVSLYTLGIMLATQVAVIAEGPTAP